MLNFATIIKIFTNIQRYIQCIESPLYLDDVIIMFKKREIFNSKRLNCKVKFDSSFSNLPWIVEKAK